MARLASRCIAAAASLLLAAFGGTATAISFPNILGQGIYGKPNASVCPTSAKSPEAACTLLQMRRGDGDPFAASFKALSEGVITKWWVTSGPASADTSAVHLRLRVFDGFKPVPGLETPYRRLPIEKPAVHRFPARLPIHQGQQIGLDLKVLGARGGRAAAPIARAVPDNREVATWAPPLARGPRRPASGVHNTKLQLLAEIEPDSDGDDWGDWTQDNCRYDPRRHSACLPDRVKPRVRISYTPRQDFIAKRKLFLGIRTSEYARVFASGLLIVGGTAEALLGSAAWLPAGGSEVFPVYINDFSARAAKRTIAKGGHPFVEATVEVTDASGNRVKREVQVRWNAG